MFMQNTLILQLFCIFISCNLGNMSFFEPLVNKFLSEAHRANPHATPNIFVLPMINVVTDPKDARKVLKDLGVDKAPTVFSDGQVEISEDGKRVPLCSLPRFQLPCCQPQTYPYEYSQGYPRGFVPPGSEYENFRPRGDQAYITDRNETMVKVCVCKWVPKSEATGLLEERTPPQAENYGGESGQMHFWEADENCKRRGMSLPVIKDQLDYTVLLDFMEADKEYWIALTKPESQTPVGYCWPDGDTRLDFLRRFGAQLSPKSGPAEYCTINLMHGKRKISVKCNPASKKAHYVCVS